MSENDNQSDLESELQNVRGTRDRRRMLAFAILASLAIAIGFDLHDSYDVKRNQDIGEARGIHTEYTMPSFTPSLSPAEAPETASAPLPQLLDLGSHYPEYPRAQSSGSAQSAPLGHMDVAVRPNIVVLDDLRAAPPKFMFIEALFEERLADYRGLPQVQTAEDYDPFLNHEDLHGHPDKCTGGHQYHAHCNPDPPIPEPSTGLLLGLGLTALGIARRRARPARKGRAASAANPSL